MSYTNKYHAKWQENRINYIISRYGRNYFKDMSVLELAPFNGYIGNRFSELGAKVTCIEGRAENVKHIKENFPHLNTIHANLDTDQWEWGNYNIIINWGLLYHLEHHHESLLVNCIKHCRLLLLESVIHDYNLAQIIYSSEKGPDQSLTNIGGAPTTSWVENIFKSEKCSFEKITLKQLNSPPHLYDWPDTNNNAIQIYKRRMWVVNCPQLK